MMDDRRLRGLLAQYLTWEDAHVGYRAAVADFATELRGEIPAGFDHSGWQIVEHLRRAQADILDFCVNPDYVYPTSSAQYWPDIAPANEMEWDGSVEGVIEDAESLRALALDESIDLFASVPAGNERQTYARELLVVADHNAYHLGQLVALRKALGCWTHVARW
jgi:hypothetical protein